MPNWCEGSIKVRGKKDNVKDFLVNGVNRYWFDIEKMENVLMPKDECVHVSEYKDGSVEIDISDAYIEESRRAFIDDLYAYFTKEDEDVCVAGHFRQAWCIDADTFKGLADKYEVDFRLYGVDCGMGFSQEVIAIRGEDVINESDNYGGYDEFVWACPFPNFGG